MTGGAKGSFGSLWTKGSGKYKTPKFGSGSTPDTPPPPPAPSITSANPSRSVNEGVSVSGTATANQTVTWSVTGLNASAVTINSSTGAWSLEATDYERLPAYAFNLVATNANGSGSQAVAITILDVDEIAPTITSPDPSGSYAEGVTVAGTLTADEPVTWSKLGTDASAVTLDTVTGVWSLEATVYATKSSYSFSFRATDLAGNTTDLPVSIAITEVVTDTTPPNLSSASGTDIGATSASLTVTTDEAGGTLYWYVSESGTTPTASDLKAGTGANKAGNQPVVVVGAQSVSVSGLASGKTYSSFFLQTDAAGNDSSVVSGSTFAAAAAANNDDNITITRGQNTLAGASGVNIGSLATVPFTATQSSFTQTSGTVGHFTLPTDGTTPVPTAAGDTANLTGGPYVFAYTSGDGTISRSGKLTIQTKANAYTASRISELATILTAGIDGKAVELAQGSTDFATATSASPISFTKWRAPNGCTIRHENPAKPCIVGNIKIRLSLGLTLDGIMVTPADRVGTVDKAWYISTTSPSAGTDQATTNTLALNNCGVSGPADPTKGVYALYVTADGAPLDLRCTGTTNLTWVAKGADLFNRYNFGLSVYFEKLRLRYWSADAFFITEGTAPNGSYTADEVLFMSPVFDTTNSSIHPDSIQIAKGVSVSNIRIGKLTFVQADGDSISQTFFSNGGSLLGLSIGNAISVGRSHHVCTLSGSDASHNISISNYTAVTQWSGIYSAGDPTTNVVNPGVILSSTIDPAHLSLSNIWMQGSLSNSSAYMPDDSVVHLGGSADISATFPNADWISSDTLKTTALANAYAGYSGLADVRWTDDMDTVLAAVEAALTPASGQVGAMKSDGTRPIAA